MARPYKDYQNYNELSSFGAAVRKARTEREISQEALADLAGIDRSYMGGIERGQHNVSLVNIRKISSALGVPIADLMALAGL